MYIFHHPPPPPLPLKITKFLTQKFLRSQYRTQETHLPFTILAEYKLPGDQRDVCFLEMQWILWITDSLLPITVLDDYST